MTINSLKPLRIKGQIFAFFYLIPIIHSLGVDSSFTYIPISEKELGLHFSEKLKLYENQAQAQFLDSYKNELLKLTLEFQQILLSFSHKIKEIKVSKDYQNFTSFIYLQQLEIFNFLKKQNISIWASDKNTHEESLSIINSRISALEQEKETNLKNETVYSEIKDSRMSCEAKIKIQECDYETLTLKLLALIVNQQISKTYTFILNQGDDFSSSNIEKIFKTAVYRNKIFTEVINKLINTQSTYHQKLIILLKSYPQSFIEIEKELKQLLNRLKEMQQTYGDFTDFDQPIKVIPKPFLLPDVQEAYLNLKEYENGLKYKKIEMEIWRINFLSAQQEEQDSFKNHCVFLIQSLNPFRHSKSNKKLEEFVEVYLNSFYKEQQKVFKDLTTNFKIIKQFLAHESRFWISGNL